MPGQVFSPVPVAPQRKGLQVVTSSELFASLIASTTSASSSSSTASLASLASSTAAGSSPASTTSYASMSNTVITTELPHYAIREHDYTVPAPPPPSPIGFRSEQSHWLPPSSNGASDGRR